MGAVHRRKPAENVIRVGSSTVSDHNAIYVTTNMKFGEGLFRKVPG